MTELPLCASGSGDRVTDPLLRRSHLMRAGGAGARITGVFLDRDGVINRKAPEGSYVRSWDEFEFAPRGLDGLALLARTAVPAIVVTNQRGIARGRMTAADLADIHRRMTSAVVAAGGRLDAVYHCPHDIGCRCRKPEVGMFEAAAERFGLLLSQTAVIGDAASDMLAARRIGALRVLIADGRSGGGGVDPDADQVVPDLFAAVMWLTDQGYLECGAKPSTAPDQASP
jgi:D-glycero-D-manno-heptose 1,7-bisphosphate phosphatase